MEKYEFVVGAEEQKIRADNFLSAKLNFITRSYLKRLMEEQRILLNGQAAKAGTATKRGDVFSVTIPESAEIDLVPEDIPIDIVYEDEDIAVINKIQGLTVHPSETQRSGTLVNALLFRLQSLSGINGRIRPGVVHRIDKNTSGLLVVAKNDAAHLSLSRQLEDKTCFRVYRAVVEGVVAEDTGTIDARLGRSKNDRKKMAVIPDGRLAITHYTVLKRYPQNTYMEFRLETGRTHQIRVHAKHIGHPLVGDPEYGFSRQKFKLNGQLLHAYRLSFMHPRTGERVFFTAPLPEYFEKVLKNLENALQ